MTFEGRVELALATSPVQRGLETLVCSSHPFCDRLWALPNFQPGGTIPLRRECGLASSAQPTTWIGENSGNLSVHNL